mmetsp:Transcript_7569/g.25757  ORF Transcript_7569/g.25757 Transcript_7569/m.25757 type:complete len:234 (+) Transcript_7569:1724-2425(+)
MPFPSSEHGAILVSCFPCRLLGSDRISVANLRLPGTPMAPSGPSIFRFSAASRKYLTTALRPGGSSRRIARKSFTVSSRHLHGSTAWIVAYRCTFMACFIIISLSIRDWLSSMKISILAMKQNSPKKSPAFSFALTLPFLNTVASPTSKKYIDVPMVASSMMTSPFWKLFTFIREMHSSRHRADMESRSWEVALLHTSSLWKQREGEICGQEMSLDRLRALGDSDLGLLSWWS